LAAELRWSKEKRNKLFLNEYFGGVKTEESKKKLSFLRDAE
jgi:hypothetical protein